jgi:hypothetical protein
MDWFLEELGKANFFCPEKFPLRFLVWPQLASRVASADMFPLILGFL